MDRRIGSMKQTERLLGHLSAFNDIARDLANSPQTDGVKIARERLEQRIEQCKADIQVLLLLFDSDDF